MMIFPRIYDGILQNKTSVDVVFCHKMFSSPVEVSEGLSTPEELDLVHSNAALLK